MGLGWRTIDLVGQDNVGEDGATNELKFSAFVVVFKNFRARDVRRHQIGRELDTVELQVKDLCNAAYKQCLGQPRGTGQQTIASCEEADQQLIDDVFLPNDDFVEFSMNFVAPGANQFNRLPVGFKCISFCHSFSVMNVCRFVFIQYKPEAPASE